MVPTKEPFVVAVTIKNVAERFEIEKIYQVVLFLAFLSKMQDNGILFIFRLKMVTTKTQGKKLLTLLWMDCSYLQYLV